MVDSVLAKNAAVAGITGPAGYVALYSTTPSGSPGTELSGVSRQAVTWSAASNGQQTGTVTFSGFSAGQTAAAFGLHTAGTGGDYYGGAALAASRTMQVGDTLRLDLTVNVT